MNLFSTICSERLLVSIHRWEPPNFIVLTSTVLTFDLIIDTEISMIFCMTNDGYTGPNVWSM